MMLVRLYVKRSIVVNIQYFDPFKNPENQIKDIFSKNYEQIILFHEYQHPNIKLLKDFLNQNFLSVQQVSLQHRGFKNRDQYTYFEILKYSKI